MFERRPQLSMTFSPSNAFVIMILFGLVYHISNFIPQISVDVLELLTIQVNSFLLNVISLVHFFKNIKSKQRIFAITHLKVLRGACNILLHILSNSSRHSFQATLGQNASLDSWQSTYRTIIYLIQRSSTYQTMYQVMQFT